MKKKRNMHNTLVGILAGFIPGKAARREFRNKYMEKEPLANFEGAREWKFMKLGPLNPDKFFFVMWHGRHSGLFSNVIVMLGFMKQIEGLNAIPVIDMQHFRSIYQEAEPVNGTNNPWEYYFHQPSAYSLDEVYRSQNVLFCDGVADHWMSGLTRENLPEYHDMFMDFLTVRQEIAEWVDQFAQTHFSGKKVLAAHLRGQDMKTVRNHPTPPTIEQMFEGIGLLENRRAVDRIFLVTDEEEYLEQFKERYGERLVFAPGFRAKAGVDSFRMKPPREFHRYQLGLETVRDVLLMSRCDYLIASGKDGLASGSNASCVAQILNGGKYEDTYEWHGNKVKAFIRK